ncbi:MAG: class I SAM-dependent methyltransferase [Rhodospirillales bacterium]|nr:class I SAM-dependent methyltransferase [Rhodospirillales bacterium]
MRPNRIPTASLAELFPGVEDDLPLTVSSYLFKFRPDQMPVLLPHEQLVLAALIRHVKPAKLLEFGTAAGHTTFLLAANSPASAQVFTLDLAPTDRGDYTLQSMLGDTRIGQCFLGKPEGAKIRQLFRAAGERMTDDLARVGPFFDYIHVDADHGYAGVKADSEVALAMISQDSIVTWHDFYAFPSYVAQPPETRGVYPYLNELAQEGTIVLRHIAGTFLVVGCKAWRDDATPGVLFQPGDVAAPFGAMNVRLAQAGWK